MIVIFLFKVCLTFSAILDETRLQDFYMLELLCLCYFLRVSPACYVYTVVTGFPQDSSSHFFTQFLNLSLSRLRNVDEELFVMKVSNLNSIRKFICFFDSPLLFLNPLSLQPACIDILKYAFVLFKVNFGIISGLLVLTNRVFFSVLPLLFFHSTLSL